MARSRGPRRSASCDGGPHLGEEHHARSELQVHLYVSTDLRETRASNRPAAAGARDPPSRNPQRPHDYSSQATRHYLVRVPLSRLLRPPQTGEVHDGRRVLGCSPGSCAQAPSHPPAATLRTLPGSDIPDQGGNSPQILAVICPAVGPTAHASRRGRCPRLRLKEHAHTLSRVTTGKTPMPGVPTSFATSCPAATGGRLVHKVGKVDGDLPARRKAPVMSLSLDRHAQRGVTTRLPGCRRQATAPTGAPLDPDAGAPSSALARTAIGMP